MPGPGSLRGHDVTMRQRLTCARATDGAAIVPASAVPAPTRFLRLIFFMLASPPLVKMMNGSVALPDIEPIRCCDRSRHVTLGGARRLNEGLTAGKSRRDRGRKGTAGA